MSARRWRDPRLLAGVVLVVGAMVVGARLVAAADDTVSYWAVADDVRAGDPVSADDLVAVEARLSGAAAEAHLRSDAELPKRLDDLTWAGDFAAGTLVSEASWNGDAGSHGHLPISVQTGYFPNDLKAGDRVDVWVGPAPGEGTAEAAVVTVEDVRVIDPGQVESLGASVTRTIVVDLGDTVLVGDQVAALAAGHVTVVRVP
ncbi:MAG: hypothetical protein QM597_10510 [Aeromicrobium sp.]|uniref:hypothetical protein n=1 Tax=Aeromicrobium sp. TaxID=1871063 RepID=UPI0039E278A1